MAAVNYANPASSSMAQRAAVSRPSQPVDNAPAGTFTPGTKVQVGSQRVIIEKYLSEGGFAHVYVVRVPSADNKQEIAVLKRVAVPDKDALANMRTEVETMKKLQGHKHIVRYMDSHANQLQGGGYEVFLLMEFCSGGGLIDFMNTRLQVRLTEPEILKIFGDVSEGVATMHYLKPPLLHRDLKVENILISKPPTSSSGVLYKLCDFGSTAPPRPAATNASEARLIEDDIQRHTTMQYRSPEMVDVWRKQPIDEKSDIWALGVLLYKLCYYTTPFEEVGTMAILNASFKYPHHPPFSDRIKRLIGAMLREDPKQRPNIYQVVQEVCSMRGTTMPIKDIYSKRTQSEVRSNQQLPPASPTVSSPPPVGISHSPPKQDKQKLPEIQPMRRGRPNAPTQQNVAKQSNPPPSKGDPFAALDSSSLKVRSQAVDQLSNKFPSLEDFSITTSNRSSFQFSNAARAGAAKAPSHPNAREASALADEVFASSRSALTKQAVLQKQTPSDDKEVSSRLPQADSARPQTVLPRNVPGKSGYVSTGTNPSPPPTKPIKKIVSDWSPKPIWRVPSHHKSPSLGPAPFSAADEAAQRRQSGLVSSSLSQHADVHRSKSQASLVQGSGVSSVRPSLDARRESAEGAQNTHARSRSVATRSRPTSGTYVDSNLDYLRSHERESHSRKRPSLELRRSSGRSSSRGAATIDENPIENDTDYLRSIEAETDRKPRTHVRSSSGPRKRDSMPSIGHIAGRFGDALRRFEVTKDEEKKASRQPPPLRTATPPLASIDDQRLLSPIPGSEATLTPTRGFEDDSSVASDIEDLSPEMRRELERQRLDREEQRVSYATAEHRGKASERASSSTRARAIQNRVQAYLSEGGQSPVKKTAEGYGRFTESPTDEQPTIHAPKPTDTATSRSAHATSSSSSNGLDVGKQRHQPLTATKTSPAASLNRTGPRPAAKPKPVALRTGTPVQNLGRGSAPPSSSRSVPPPNTGEGSRLAALLARDQEGVAAAGATLPDGIATDVPAIRRADGNDDDGQRDWEQEFSKRYPSLSGIELVETEIEEHAGVGSQRGIRIRDV